MENPSVGQPSALTGDLMQHLLRHCTRWLDSNQAIHSIVVLAVLLRVVALTFLARYPLVGDATLYHDFAVGILEGRTIYPLVPPAVGLYLAFFYRLFSISPMVARISMLPLAVGFMYTLYTIAARFAGRTGANLLTLVFAIYPLHVLCSLEPITEMPASLLLLISVSLVLTICAKGGLRNFLVLGVVLGLLILTRPSALLLMGFLPLYLALKSRKWLASALVAAIPTAMIGIWIFAVYGSTGQFVMINFSSTQNVFLGNNAYTPLYRTWWFTTHGDEAQLPAGYRALNTEIMTLPWYEQNALYRREALASITARPDLFAVRTFNRVRVYFAFDSYTGSLALNRYHTNRKFAFSAIAVDVSLYLLVTISAILFLFIVPRSSERFRPTLTILTLAVLYACPYFLSVSHPIYHFPIVPLLGLLAAALWSDIVDGRTSLARAISSRSTNHFALSVALVLFGYIQIEYAVVMYLFSSH